MRQKPKTPKSHGEKGFRDIRQPTRKLYSSDEKIRIVLDGLKGEDSIAELCRREGTASRMISRGNRCRLNGLRRAIFLASVWYGGVSGIPAVKATSSYRER